MLTTSLALWGRVLDKLRFSASHKIPHIFCNAKFHYHIHNPSILHLKTHFNIILPSAPQCSSGLIRSCVPTKTLHMSFCSYACYMTYPSHPPRFDHLSNIWQGLEMEFLIMKFSLGTNFGISKCHQVFAKFFPFTWRVQELNMYTHIEFSVTMT